MQQVSGMPGGFGLPPVANPPGGLGNSVRLVKLETDHLGGEVALGAILQVIALASAAFTRQQPRLDLRTSEATRNVSRRCLRLRGILKCRKGLDTRCLRDADNGLQHGEGPSPWLGPRPLMNLGASWPTTRRGWRSRRSRFARSCLRRQLCSMGSRRHAFGASSCGTPAHVPLTRGTHSLVRNRRRCWGPRPRMCSRPV